MKISIMIKPCLIFQVYPDEESNFIVYEEPEGLGVIGQHLTLLPMVFNVFIFAPRTAVADTSAPDTPHNILLRGNTRGGGNKKVST